MKKATKQPKLSLKDRQKQLFAAIQEGDLGKFRALAPKNEEINKIYSHKLGDNNFHEITLLFFAVQNQKIPIVLELIAKKADLNIAFKFSDKVVTAFTATLALSNANPENDLYLIAMFRNQNRGDLKFTTPDIISTYLFFLCRSYSMLSVENVEEEFSKLKNSLPKIINLPDHTGKNLLQVLVNQKAPIEMLNLVLKYGANPAGIDFSYLKHKYNTLEITKTVIKKDQLPLLELLLNIFFNAKEAESLISYASTVNACIATHELLHKKAFQDSIIGYTLSLLILKKINNQILTDDELAIFRRNTVVTKHAINETKDGLTPLYHIVTSLGDIALVKFMLEHGANPNKGEVRTAVHGASQEKNFEILKLLLDHNGDPNLPDSDGASALHRSIFKNDIKSAELILQHGANLELAITSTGEKPLYLAFKNNNIQCAKLLLAAGANIKSEPIKDSTKNSTYFEFAMALYLKSLLNNAPNELPLNFPKTIIEHALENKIYIMDNKNLDPYLQLSIFFEDNILHNLLSSFKIEQEKLQQEQAVIKKAPEIAVATNSISTPATPTIKLEKTPCQNESLVSLTLKEYPPETFLLPSLVSLTLVDINLVSAAQSHQFTIVAAKAPSDFHREYNLLSSPNNTIFKLQLLNDSAAIKSSPLVTNNNDPQPSLTMENESAAQSARAYLQSMGYTVADIQTMQKNNKNRKRQEKNQLTLTGNSDFWSTEKFLVPDSLTWQSVTFNKLILEAISLGANQFFYLDETALRNDGCPEEILEKIRKMRLKMDGDILKKLQGNFILNVKINNENNTSQINATHELRILPGEERILLCPITADDDNRYKLYLGCKYLSQGLHTFQAQKSLEKSKKTVQITLHSPESKVAPVSKFSASSSVISKI